MDGYITDKEFNTLIEDMLYKLSNDQLDDLVKMLNEIMYDADHNNKYIDRTYIGSVKEKKRIRYTKDIASLIKDMSVEQLQNVYTYVRDEIDEPNHEAEALDAILKLSKGIKSTEDGK